MSASRTGAAAAAADFLIVMHDFIARSPDELSLKKNEKVELIERDDEYGDGWYQGRCCETDKIGLFPQVYTKPYRPADEERKKLLSGNNSDEKKPVEPIELKEIKAVLEEDQPKSKTVESEKPSNTETQPQTFSIIADDKPTVKNESISLSEDKKKKTISTKLSEETTDKASSAKEEDAISLATTPISAQSQESLKMVASTPPPPPEAIVTPVAIDKSTTTKNPNKPTVEGTETRTKPLSIDNHRKSASWSVAGNKPMNYSSQASTSSQDDQSGSKPQMIRSPVVEDTLSDIDQAIHQIRKHGEAHSRKNSRSGNRIPPAAAPPLEQDFDDSESDYSRSNIDTEPFSFQSRQRLDQQSSTQGSEQIPSQASSESNDIYYTIDEVRSWTPSQVATYFMEQNVPSNICEKFEVQEITGSILLQLEMAHLKELEIASFGKRFEVWKEIERLKEMLGIIDQESSNMIRSGMSISIDEGSRGSRPRSSTTGGTGTGSLSKITGINNRSPTKNTHSHEGFDPSHADRSASATSESGNSSQKRTSMGRLSQYGQPLGLDTNMVSPMAAVGRSQSSHGRDASFDRNWSHSLAGGRSNSSAGIKVSNPAIIGGRRLTNDSGFAGSQPETPNIPERLNTSSDEGKGTRKTRDSISGANARQSSHMEEQRQRTGLSSSRQSKIGSNEIFNKNASPSTSPRSPTHQAALAYHMPKARKKIPNQPSPDAYLYEQPKISTGISKQLSVDYTSKMGDDGTPSPEVTPNREKKARMPIQIQTKQASRAASEGTELLRSPQSAGAVTNRTLTPDDSASNPSVTLVADDGLNHDHKDPSIAFANKPLRTVVSASGLRQKSKKHRTSAWTEGLREISPAEAASEADFSGWMKKRSSGGVVGSWKNRYFVLKGRRLSYFYSSEDTKERGLIDITSHRVLNAADDRLVNLHASVAAITSHSSPNQESLAKDHKSPTTSPTTSHKGGWFIFKLVPPAPGAAKGVTFTPPKLHYFGTDTKEVGRQWMAAMMKATIDRDESQPVISSFSAATISLAKARELRARPPGFGEESQSEEKKQGIDVLGMDFDIDTTIGDITSQQDDDTLISNEEQSSSNGVNRTKSQPLSSRLHE